MKRIIALTGMPGSGKSSVAAIFEKEGYVRIHLGDVTDKALKERGLARNEQNENLVRTTLRKEHGMAAYAKLSLPRIAQYQRVVIDGLYSYEEFELLDSVFGPSVFLVAVAADAPVRHRRIIGRQNRIQYSKEDAQERDAAQLKELNISKTISNAHYTLQNNGTQEELLVGFRRLMQAVEEHFKSL